MRPPPALRSAVAAFLLFGVSGCGSRVIDLRDPPDPDPVPEPTSPVAAVERLSWCWNHRRVDPYEDLFTADYQFVASSSDTGVPSPLYRESELQSAENLFITGHGAHPPATFITFLLDYTLLDQPSPEPGHDPRVHRVIESLLDVGVRVPGGDYRVVGRERFALVRGDSARIPQALLDRGVRPDSTRWWVERWEDQILGQSQPAAGALPAAPMTIARLKAIYLEDPGATSGPVLKGKRRSRILRRRFPPPGRRAVIAKGARPWA